MRGVPTRYTDMRLAAISSDALLLEIRINDGRAMGYERQRIADRCRELQLKGCRSGFRRFGRVWKNTIRAIGWRWFRQPEAMQIRLLGTR